MKQVFFGSHGVSMATSATPQFNSVFHGKFDWGTTESTFTVPMSVSGTFRNLSVTLNGTPGAGNNYAFTLRKNGADQSVTTTISDSATTGTDFSNSFTVVAGDLVCIKVIATSTPTARTAKWTIEFETSTTGYNITGGFSQSNLTSGRYHSISEGGNEATTYPQPAMVIPHSCTLRALYIELTAAPASTHSRTFTIYKNGSSEASTATVVTGAATNNNTTGLSVSFSPGDTVAINHVSSGTPTASRGKWGLLFESDVDGNSMLLSNTHLSVSTADSYSQLGASRTDGVAESTAQVKVSSTGFDLKNFYVDFRVAPGATKSWVCSLRLGAVSQALAVTVSDANTTGNDTSDTISVVTDDLINIFLDGTGTPATTTFRSGMTMYIAPAVAAIPNKIYQTNQSVKRASLY